MKLGLNLIPLYSTVRAVQTVYRTVISWREMQSLWCKNPTILILCTNPQQYSMEGINMTFMNCSSVFSYTSGNHFYLIHRNS